MTCSACQCDQISVVREQSYSPAVNSVVELRGHSGPTVPGYDHVAHSQTLLSLTNYDHGAWPSEYQYGNPSGLVGGTIPSLDIEWEPSSESCGSPDSPLRSGLVDAFLLTLPACRGSSWGSQYFIVRLCCSYSLSCILNVIDNDV